jgi:hypothetical protein
MKVLVGLALYGWQKNKRKMQSLKIDQNNKIENLACSVSLSLFMDGI